MRTFATAGRDLLGGRQYHMAVLIISFPCVAALSAPSLHDITGRQVLTRWDEPHSVSIGPADGRATAIVLSPCGSPVAGNVTVMVSGVAFRDMGDVRCRFCLVETRGFVLSDGAITCTVPSLEAIRRQSAQQHVRAIPAACKVDVTLNGVDYAGATSRSTFWYYNISRVGIRRLKPSGGPAAGGTLVSIAGMGFVDYGGAVQGAKCRFGEMVVPATVRNYNTMECLSPPVADLLGSISNGADTIVSLYVSLNGHTGPGHVAGGADFHYAPPARLTEIHPIGGSIDGDAIVTLHGDGFVDLSFVDAPCGAGEATSCKMHQASTGIEPARALPHGVLCVFEGVTQQQRVAVPATHAAERRGTEIKCVTPRDALPALARPVGPWCSQFGHWAAPCDNPAYHRDGFLAVTVRVTLNGNVSDAASNALVYVVRPNALPLLHYIEPQSGPPSGGTLVRLVGKGLLSLGVSPICRFGHLEVPAIIGGLNASQPQQATQLLSLTTLHDGREPRTFAKQAGRSILCKVPPDPGFGSRFIRVGVSLDGHRFSASTLAFRYTQYGLTSIWPWGGRLDGGTKIRVEGHGFAPLGAMLCLVGDVAVPATRVAARAISCVTPAVHQPAVVSVGVSLNGAVDASAVRRDNLTFAYFDESQVYISAVTPASGPARGGTAVTLWGAGLAVQGRVQCAFGDHEPVDGGYDDLGIEPAFATVGQRTISKIVCRTRSHQLSAAESAVSVRISLNGAWDHSITSAAASYVYTHPCQASYELSATSNAFDALARFVARNHPHWTHYDTDGDGHLNGQEVRQAISDRTAYATWYATNSSSSAVDAVAALQHSACFLPEEAGEVGKMPSRADDTSVSDGLGGLFPTVGADQ